MTAQIITSRDKTEVRSRVVITFEPSGVKRTFFPTVGEQTEAVANGEVEFHASDWGEAPPLLDQWSDGDLRAWLEENPKRRRVRPRKRRRGDYFDSMRP